MAFDRAKDQVMFNLGWRRALYDYKWITKRQIDKRGKGMPYYKGFCHGLREIKTFKLHQILTKETHQEFIKTRVLPYQVEMPIEFTID